MLQLFHPVILAAAAGVLIAAVALVSAWSVQTKAARTALVVLAFVFLLPAAFVIVAFNLWLVDLRFRTYRSFYKDIRVGMTREQVLAAMQRRYPSGEARQRPTTMSDTPDALGFFMDPETSTEPNCEGIFLTLERGRVTKKEYSPD